MNEMKGNGTIFTKNRNGKTYYEGQLTIGYDSKGKRIRKTIGSYERKEVQQKMNELRFRYQTGFLNSGGEILLQDWYYTWLFEYRKNDLKPSSFQRYESLLRNYIMNTKIGLMKISELKTIDYQRYLNDLIDNCKSVSIAKNVKKCISTCLNAAVDEDIIHKNYCSAVKLPAIQRTKKKYPVYTLKEQELILNALNFDAKDVAIKLAFATGMRLGELTALKWEDINLLDFTIDINKSLKQVQIIDGLGKDERHSELILQSPKTENSIRVIPIPATMNKILKDWKLEQKKLKLKHADVYNDNSFVFTNVYGAPFEPRVLPRRLEYVLKQLDIPYRNFHAIRHTYSTRLFEADVPVKTVQTLLGHKDISTTMNIYTHVSKDKKNEAVEKLNSLFG